MSFLFPLFSDLFLATRLVAVRQLGNWISQFLKIRISSHQQAQCFTMQAGWLLELNDPELDPSVIPCNKRGKQKGQKQRTKRSGRRKDQTKEVQIAKRRQRSERRNKDTRKEKQEAKRRKKRQRRNIKLFSFSVSAFQSFDSFLITSFLAMTESCTLAIQHDEKWHKAWHTSAIVHYRILTYYGKQPDMHHKIESHLLPAVDGFIKSISLGTE